MLEVYQEIVNKLAELPVEHSWALPLLQITDEEKAEKAEEMWNEWIRETVHKEYPELPKEYNLVERALRHHLLYLLELEAIREYRDRRLPEWEAFLPEVQDVSDAVMLANADTNYTMTSKEMDQAADLMIKILQGQIKPDLNNLIPR